MSSTKSLKIDYSNFHNNLFKLHPKTEHTCAGFVLMEYLKGQLKDSSATPDLTVSFACLDECNLLKLNLDNDFGTMSIEELWVYIGTSRRKRIAEIFSEDMAPKQKRTENEDYNLFKLHPKTEHTCAGFVLMEYLKGQLKDSSATPDLTVSFACLDECNLLKLNLDNDFGTMSIEELWVYIGTSRRKRIAEIFSEDMAPKQKRTENEDCRL
ncbi:hypothetical protein LguiA_025633 [Lonicera macranthoides]